MVCDCHIHMVLDGVNWKNAIRRHENGPEEGFIHAALRRYRDQGYTYLRDGGDRWGVGKRARMLAADYGITYRTPLAPLCKAGHYGGFLGAVYANDREFAALVGRARAEGADFIKIMISGLMDFDHPGVLTEEGLSDREIRQRVHIAHEEGFSVMAHANGDRAVTAAALAGVDSVEHGAYLGQDALCAMKEAGTVWVPTLSAVGNLRGRGRFSEIAVREILEGAMENVARFGAMGGLLAPGSDAGAWAVPHGSGTEYALMVQALGRDADRVLDRGICQLQQKF